MTKEPKPYDLIDNEPYPNKSLTFINNTHKRIRIGQLASTWNTVNFVIESEHTREKEKYTGKTVEWLATLYHKDRIELSFHPPKRIEK